MSIFRRNTTTTQGGEVAPPSYEDAAASILNASGISHTNEVPEHGGNTNQEIEGRITPSANSLQEGAGRDLSVGSRDSTEGDLRPLFEATTYRNTKADIASPLAATRPPATLTWPHPEKDDSRPLDLVFSKFSFNSVLVIPSNSADSGSRYHISVDIDVFCPTSWTTTIRRGDSEVGDYVGEFRTGSTEPSLVRVGSRLSTFATAFKASRFTIQHHYTWHLLPNRDLYWIREFDDELVTFRWTCFFCKKGVETAREPFPIASYTAEQKALRPQRVSPSLRVEQRGLEVLDHIIVSLLLCEDTRLRPKYKPVTV